jgi:TolB-like protein/Tfp pilus assembly protein PilF
MDVQNSMSQRNAAIPAEPPVVFRIGVHLGDVVEEADGDLMGDGVNIAARIESIAAPGGICLSEQAYWQVKARIELDVSDLGPIQLKNIAEPIRLYSVHNGAPVQTKAAANQTEKSASPRLSIVVLPFANIGGDSEQDHFVDGVTESLTTDLSRIRGSFVIGRNTAFTYKGKAVDLKQIGRELNVRYVLEGSVQRRGSRMRVNVQLIDAEAGHQLWAERFDKLLADFFDMQDEIVARLANALNLHLVAAEARRAEQSPNPDSVDLYFQGLAWLNKSLIPGNLAQARSFFDRALSADPNNIEALVGSARTDFLAGSLFFVTDPETAFAAAEEKLTRALSTVPDHPRAHSVFGFINVYAKRAARGIAECEYALASDRNLAQAHATIGWCKIFIDRAAETETHVGDALRLSPRDNLVNIWMNYVGVANSVLGRYEQAVAWHQRSIEANRNFPPAYLWLAAALGQLGRLGEARSAAEAALALNPSFTVARARSLWTAMGDNPTYLAGLQPVFEGLRKAGMPEG